MEGTEHLLLAGASVRAAAFSALRAGLRPWCVDLFADADLAARCPAQALPANGYPRGLPKVFATAPQGPWMYTGGLENHPGLVARLARLRPLWGNEGSVLRRIGAPRKLVPCLRDGNIPCPDIWVGSHLPHEVHIPQLGQTRWLVKPVRGAGGRGITFWNGGTTVRNLPARLYLQEYIEGEACAAIYLGDGRSACGLGVTRQLVGEPWLHADPFHYCGSVGPLSLPPAAVEAFQKLGSTLLTNFQLRGLFGVDAVLRDGIPYPVEVNPRYTASVELLEYATGTPALALHRRVFDPTAPEILLGPATGDVLGKAVLYARAPLVFPADGPWMSTLRQPGGVWELPAFADIPQPGTRLEPGQPVFTFFARADSLPSCIAALQHTAADLDRWLYR